jgi:TonB-dependent SusC/RagA subfamily outer membrane receptor
VVVVGYGVQKKNEVTGNLAVIKGAVVADKPIQSFKAGIAGRAPGVQITVPNGVLNSPPVFRIRGTNSISLSSYPLIVIDGVPSFTNDYSSTNAAANPLASINPNDIESIDVAKDAAATAIYGSRAANGVVFITTKKGKAGKAKVTYDGWVGFSNPYRLPSMMNAQQYTNFKNAAVANNPTQSAVQFNIATGANGAPVNTNSYDYVYRQGISQNHNVSVSGGSDNTTYYFSAGYTAQQGIIRKNNFDRLNDLFNVDSRVNKVMTVGGKISYSNEKNLAATSSGSLSGEAFNTAGLGRLALVLPPSISPYNPDGSYNINGASIGYANIVGTSVTYYNPVPQLDLNRRTW